MSRSQVSEMYEVKQRFNKARGAKNTNICRINDKESMGEVLKKMRDRSQTRHSFKEKENEEETPKKNLIQPGMYGYLKKRI